MTYDPRRAVADLDLSPYAVAMLSRGAAVGNAVAARELAALTAYLDSCGRGEVELPPHPSEGELRAWNAAAAGRDAAPSTYPGPPVTASAILARLAAASMTVAVDGGGLVLEGNLPADLELAVGVLWPLLVGAIAGVSVYGQDRAGRPVPVSPDRPLPRTAYLLCTAGGSAWHRLNMTAFPPAFERGI